MLIKGHVNNIKNVDIVFDTGCCQNVIEKRFAGEIEEPTIRYILHTVGGNKINPIGVTRVFLELGTLSGYISALVIDKSPKPLILGTRFLKTNEVNIDYRKLTVTLGSPEKMTVLNFSSPYSDSVLATFFNTIDDTDGHNEDLYILDEEQETYKVAAHDDYILKPNIRIKVKLTAPRLNENKLTQGWMFIENDTLLRPKGIICVTTPYYSNNTLFAEIVTKKHHQIKIYKGTTIGFFERRTTQNLANSPLLFLDESPDTDERVTMDDHKIDHITDPKIKEDISKLLEEFSDVFSKSPKFMGKTDIVEHSIDIGDAKPIKMKPYRVSQREREIIDKQITEMLKYNVISPSHSPWASPVVLVKKKNGETRFCVDYRKLNSVTKKSTYPLPNIEDIMTYLGKARYFSSLDMFSGFWQVKIKEESRPLTSFICQGHGSYQFNVLSFGLCNAPSTFQELADIVFRDMKWNEILCYLDDIIIFSETIEEHLLKLQKVFIRLREAGLTLKPNKCEYLKERIYLLGFIITKDGILPDDAKISAIKNFPKPKNVKAVQSFIGLCNYYRKFIKNFSQIARPLHEITKKDNFFWTDDQEDSFETLKQKLTNPPVLAHFDPNQGCELHVDASRSGIGAVMLQENTDAKLHPVAYISRSLTKAEKNYTITELEGLAAIWALTYLRHLIYGRPVKIITDHHALCWLKTLKDPTGRLARWAIKLSEFEYTIVHKSGLLHRDADCISRYPVLKPEETENFNEIPTFLLESEDISKLQLDDENLKQLISAIKNPTDASIGIRKRSKNFRLINDVLYKVNSNAHGRENLLVVPRNLVEEILHSHHSEPLCGHLGISKTLEKIKTRYYWDKQQKDIEKFVKGCPQCQSRKGQQTRKPIGLLQPIPVGTPFEKVGIDLLGPFRRSKSGKTFIIVATDYATRWAETQALPNGKAGPVAKFILEKIITRHGAPKHILSDQGKVFRSELVLELLRTMGTSSQYTTAYHPSTNGLTERLNKTIADMISVYTNKNQTNWDEYLPHVTFAYNTSKQDTTHFSPFMLVYGREPVLPLEANLLESPAPKDSHELRENALVARNLAIENIQ